MIRIPSNSLKIKNIRARNILHLTKNNSGGNKTDGLRMVLRPTSCRRRRLRPTSCRRRRPFAGISSNQWSRECSNLRKNVLSGSVWSLRRTWINDRGTVKAYNWFLFEQDFQKSQPSKESAQVWTIKTKWKPPPKEHSTSPYSSRVWGFVKHAQTNQVNHRRLMSSWS